MVDKLLKEFQFEVELVSWRMPDNAIVEPKPSTYAEEGMLVATDLAQALGVSIRFDSPITGTRAALEATKIANTMGHGFAYSLEIFNRKWIEGKDISDRELLFEIAEQLGLNHEQFCSSFLERQGRQAVEGDFLRSSEEKIWTIPAYQVNELVIQIHHFKDMPSLEQLRKFIKLGESFLNEK